MSTERAIKKAVEQIKNLLPANLEDMPAERQIQYLDVARHRIDGISWLLVAEGRLNTPIGKWVKAEVAALDQRMIDVARQGGRHEAA
jgi:hypothetical protein